MTKFVIDPLPRGVSLDGCAVARASKEGSIVFVRTSDGKIFHTNRRWLIDLTDEYGSNAADRSCYAKLAGVRVKDIDDARKAIRVKTLKDDEKRETAAMRATAARLGFRVVRVAAAHAG